MVTSIITSSITTLLTIGGLLYYSTKDDEIDTAEEKEIMDKKIKDFKRNFTQYDITVEIEKAPYILYIVTITNPKEEPIDMEAVKDYFGMTTEDNSEIISNYFIQIAKY